MKKEDVEILKKMKNGGVDNKIVEEIFSKYQKEEKEHWFEKMQQKIIALYIETMRDIISNRRSDKRTHRKNIELNVAYEIGDIFNMNFNINDKNESNFFHPAMIVHKNSDYIYVVIGTSTIDKRKAFHYSKNKEKDKKLFLIKTFESKFGNVSLDKDTVFLLNSIQAVNLGKIKRSKIIGSIKNREIIKDTITDFYKNFF